MDIPNSTPGVAVFITATGKLEYIAPSGHGLLDGQSSIALPGDWSTETHEWSAVARAMVESPDKVGAKLVAEIKAEAEARKMVILSGGDAKKTEYAAKEREVNAWEALGSTAAKILIAFNAMTADRKATSFPHALADAAAFGDTPASAIARFKSGIVSSRPMAEICAAEAVACKAIRTAATPAMKRAAAAEVVWPTPPA